MRGKDRWGTKEKPDANKSTGGRVERNKEEREPRRLSDCNMASSGDGREERTDDP